MTHVAGEEGVGGAAGEAVGAAGFFDHRCELAAVGLVGEVAVGEAGLVVGDKMGKVLANEAEVGCT